MNSNLTEKDADELFNSDVLMVFPTDTLYGLGGNASNEEVVERIYRIKRREKTKPLSLHLFSIEDIGQYTNDLSSWQKEMINDLLPGPYTLILPAGTEAPPCAVSQEQKVGIRVPDSPTFRQLEEQVSYPLAGTSVNRSGEPPMTDFDSIVDRYGGRVELFIQSQEPMEQKSSTVLDLSQHPPQTLRGEYPRE